MTGDSPQTPAPSGVQSRVQGAAQQADAERAEAATRKLRRGVAIQRQGALFFLVALLVFGTLRYGGDWLFGQNMANVLADDVKYALIALGMTFVIMSGGIDLSVGSTALLGGVLAAQYGDQGWPVAIAVAVAAGALLGAVQGGLIARFHLEPFIVTLAGLLVARGLALYFADNRAVTSDPSLTEFGQTEILGLNISVWTMFLLFAVGAGVQRYTAFGRGVLAVGGNADAARLMGLPVNRVRGGVYVISGSLAALAGAFVASTSGSISTDSGVGWELTAIAAVVVGGTLLTGGVGSVLSTLVGVVLLQLVFNIINFENGRGTFDISSYWESVIRGGFLLLVVLLQIRLARTRPKGAVT
jgi:ribose transport system permease protein